MSGDAPPPYPGPPAPLWEEKHGPLSSLGVASPAVTQPLSMPVPPPGYGPLAYEVAQPGYIPPYMPGEGGLPYMPHGYCPPAGPHSPMGYYPPTSGHYPSASGHTATVILPPEAATTVTVLQGEIFHLTPVQTVCPRCQQAITTRISHEIGLLNMLLCCFCCAAGCDLGCCLIPCVIDEFKDVMHSCPNCKSHIYTYKRVC